MTLRVLFATDVPRHPESAAIEAWLTATPGLAHETVPLRRTAARAGPGDVVWIHGTAPLALESLGAPGPRLLTAGRVLLSGGAAVLPAAAGVDPAAPNDVVHGGWEDPGSGAPALRGHASFRGHPLFEGLGYGVDTWAPRPADPYTRVAHVRPTWPARGRVIAVERIESGMNADRATIWEYDMGGGRLVCVGAYLPLHGRSATWRVHAERLALNALRYVTGRETLSASVPRTVWRLPDVGVMEDRSLGVPELPLFEESLGSTDFRLRSSGPAGVGVPFTLAGRRSFVIGDEQFGLSEVWAHPLRLAVRPRIMGGVAEVVTVTPVGIERRVRIEDALLLERVVVPRDGPACFIEWHGRDRAVSFEVEWSTDLRLAHPYPAWATAPLRWRRAGRGVVVTGGTEASEGDRVVFAFSARPDRFDVEGDARDGTRVRLRARITVQPRNSVRLIMAGAVAEATLPRLLRAADRTHAIARSRAGAADQVLADRLSLRTPEPEVDQAVEWAKVRLASYASESQQGAPLRLAGYGPSGEMAEPARCSVVDAVWSGDAALALGDFDGVRELLVALGAQQSPSGQIPSECSTAGPVRHGTAHATGLYLRLVARHVAWCGDVRFIQAEWPRVLRAYEFIRQAEPPASLSDGAVRAAALAGLIHAAEAIGDRGSAVEFGRQASSARSAARALAAGTGAGLASPGHMVALLLGVVPPDWVGDGPGGEPEPGEPALWAGWLSWAGYVAGRPDTAFRRWRGIARHAFQGARGSWGAGGPEGCPDHSASTAMAVSPLVYGLLGAEPDATRNRLTLRPRPPREWDRFEVRTLRMAEAALTLRYRRSGSVHRFGLVQSRGVVPVQLVLEPELAGRLGEARVDGRPADLDTVAAGDRTRVSVQLVLDEEREVELVMDEAPPLVPNPSS